MTMRTDDEVLGRDGVDNLDAILAVKADAEAVFRTVKDEADTVFTWDYERSRPALSRLYEKAKKSQWNAIDLPWETEVDQEKLAVTSGMASPQMLESMGVDLTGTVFEKWGDREWIGA